jgi:hypothetical protein
VSYTDRVTLWPKTDPEVRARLLQEMRRRQHLAAHALTPTERLRQLDDMLALVRRIGRASGDARTSDETVEESLRMLAHLREVGGRA